MSVLGSSTGDDDDDVDDLVGQWTVLKDELNWLEGWRDAVVHGKVGEVRKRGLEVW